MGALWFLLSWPGEAGAAGAACAGEDMAAEARRVNAAVATKAWRRNGCISDTVVTPLGKVTSWHGPQRVNRRGTFG
ncbi:hypothetical protein GCM10017711_20500 [Paeniglutamicibacter sulfureus]